MPGMGGSLSNNNPLVVSAFQAALRHQGLIVVLLLAVAICAWLAVNVVPARPLAGRLGAVTGADEAPGRRLLRVSFGLIWIADGLLQTQQAMPVGMPTGVVQPAAASSPGWVQHLVGDGVAIWTRHPIPAAASAVWIQIGVGVLLLVCARGRLSQLAGALSVGWGLVVWVFGEAFGGIFGSGLSWMFGAPGAVLFYCVAGVMVALPERAWLGRRLGRSVLAVMGVFLVGMAVLQAWPGRGFWQGQVNPRATAGALVSMTQTMSQTAQPHALSSLITQFGLFDAAHGWAVNLFVVTALLLLGVAFLTGRRRPTLAALGMATVLCLADWVLVEDLGFLGGVGTDPNSMIPLVLVLAGGYLALTRDPVPIPTPAIDTPVGVAARALSSQPVRLRKLGAPSVLRVVAALGAFGVFLVGAAPMALASVSSGTDTIVTEGINGQPGHSDSPAPGFALTDQQGAPVSLAELRGRTVALTFLDPVCTSSCPLIAQDFRQVDAMLGPSAARTTAFVAVVANPTYLAVPFVQAFDTQEHLGGVPNWYFLTGSLLQLTRVWAAYGIGVQTIGDGAMAAHGETAFVIDRAGRLRATFGADPGDELTSSASFTALVDDEMRAVLRQ